MRRPQLPRQDAIADGDSSEEKSQSDAQKGAHVDGKDDCQKAGSQTKDKRRELLYSLRVPLPGQSHMEWPKEKGADAADVAQNNQKEALGKGGDKRRQGEGAKKRSHKVDEKGKGWQMEKTNPPMEMPKDKQAPSKVKLASPSELTVLLEKKDFFDSLAKRIKPNQSKKEGAVRRPRLVDPRIARNFVPKYSVEARATLLENEEGNDTFGAQPNGRNMRSRSPPKRKRDSKKSGPPSKSGKKGPLKH